MENKIVVLEGFHVCKHAVRFDSDIIELVTADRPALAGMLDEYASDIKDTVLEMVQEIDADDFANYSDIKIRTPLAGKAQIGMSNVPIDGRAVLLDNPRDLENIGAVVRLSAGMGASAVITTGDVDPWHKNCLRGSQGLHFALPVVHLDDPVEARPLQGRPIVVFDESGDDLTGVVIPENAVLVFGSERQGVSKQWIEKADVVVRIPQRSGVSSYNLATSVAMGVYHATLKK